MSSFVIAKSEYIKAAGLLAGIAQATERATHEFWLYDFTMNRNMIGEDYHRVFSDCYEKNALSVAEQYDDEHRETDPDEYKSTFIAYMAKGKKLYYEGKVKTIINPLNSFFQSVLYQTEKPEYSWYMELLFGRIIRALVEFTTSDSQRCWGDLDNLAI